MLTNTRVGSGRVNIGSGILQGELTISESAEHLPLGSGVPYDVDERLVIRRAASIRFSTTDVANTAGLALVPGALSPTTVNFEFRGSGDTYRAGLSGLLSSVEYRFSEMGELALCTMAFDAVNGTLTAGADLADPDYEQAIADVLRGIGDISWGDGAALIQGGVGLTVRPTVLDQVTGIPLALREREIRAVEVTMSASFAQFAGLTVGDTPADLAFTHNSGLVLTVLDAMLVRGDRRFVDGELALANCEWVGRGLTIV